MATFAPLEHWPAVVLTVLIAALYAWSVLALVTRILRRPRVQVLAVSWLLFGATVVPTYAWFRQALTTMLPMALMVMAVVVTLDGVRRPRPLALVLAVALHAVALSFSERALILPVVLAALLVLAARGQLLVRRSWIGIGLRLLPHVAPEHRLPAGLPFRGVRHRRGVHAVDRRRSRRSRSVVRRRRPAVAGGWPGPLAPGQWPVLVRGPALARGRRGDRAGHGGHGGRGPTASGTAGARRPSSCATYAFPALALIYPRPLRRSPMSPPATTCGCSRRRRRDRDRPGRSPEVTWVSPARPTDLRIRRVIAAAGAGLTAVLCAIS